MCRQQQKHFQGAEHNVMVKRKENRNAVRRFPTHLSIPTLSLSLLHTHLSAQKVSKCQMGVVFIFNGVIFLHRNTVCLCVFVCEGVKGNTEQNEIEQDIENGKLQLATKKARTHLHTEACTETEMEQRMHSIYFSTASCMTSPLSVCHVE